MDRVDGFPFDPVRWRLRRAEDVDDANTKTHGGGLDDLRRPLVSEGNPEGVVRVVRTLGRGQQIGEQFAGVVEPGGAVVSHVRKKQRQLAEATGQ